VIGGSPSSEEEYPWPEIWPIKSPIQFRSFLKELRHWVAMGQLQQIKYDASDVPFIAIENIPEKGPWPDCFEAYFTNNSGVLYELLIETYHGSGGQWKRLDDSEEITHRRAVCG
jgi:hypothetical protein